MHTMQPVAYLNGPTVARGNLLDLISVIALQEFRQDNIPGEFLALQAEDLWRLWFDTDSAISRQPRAVQCKEYRGNALDSAIRVR